MKISNFLITQLNSNVSLSQTNLPVQTFARLQKAQFYQPRRLIFHRNKIPLPATQLSRGLFSDYFFCQERVNTSEQARCIQTILTEQRRGELVTKKNLAPFSGIWFRFGSHDAVV